MGVVRALPALVPPRWSVTTACLLPPEATDPPELGARRAEGNGDGRAAENGSVTFANDRNQLESPRLVSD